MLLHTLGISEGTLLTKQAQHLTFLEDVNKGDPRAAFQFVSYLDRTEIAEKLLLDGVESVYPMLRNLVKQEHARMINKRNEQRCRILVPKSRLLFGVCDPAAKGGSTGRLKDGECFVRITQDGDGGTHVYILGTFKSLRLLIFPNTPILWTALYSPREENDRVPI